jgi:tetratricopeptide (TPR) repeat protein
MAMGRVYMALGDYDRALDAIQRDRALKLRQLPGQRRERSVPARRRTTGCGPSLPRYFMITKAMFETGKLEDARKGFDDLLGIEQVRANGEIHWQLLNERGRLAERQSQGSPGHRLLRAGRGRDRAPAPADQHRGQQDRVSWVTSRPSTAS